MRGTPLDDTFFGGCGDDRMYGHGGQDLFYGDGSSRDCSGPATDDDVIHGGPARDYLFGVDAQHIGTDSFYSGHGNDIFRSSGGRERFYGGAGSDIFKVQRRATSASLHIDLAAGTYTIGSHSGVVRHVENVNGGKGDDVIYGDGHANQLVGAGGSDELHGRGGDDQLYGDYGSSNDSPAWRDKAFGGHGSDLCDAEVEHSCER